MKFWKHTVVVFKALCINSCLQKIPLKKTDPCYETVRSGLLVRRTNLFYLEYNYTPKEVDVTLVSMLNIDRLYVSVKHIFCLAYIISMNRLIWWASMTGCCPSCVHWRVASFSFKKTAHQKSKCTIKKN